MNEDRIEEDMIEEDMVEEDMIGDSGPRGQPESRARALMLAPLRKARRLAAALRDRIDRALHHRRHEAARQRVASALGLTSRGDIHREVLFVCLGNICRSPYAEHRLRALLRAHGADHGSDHVPDHDSDGGPGRDSDGGPDLAHGVAPASSGFILPGRSSPHAAIQVARERGIELSRHRSSALSPAEVDQAHLVVVMTSRQRRDLRRLFGRSDAVQLGDLDPGPIPRRDIADPYGRSVDEFRRVYARIDAAVGVLAEVVRGSGTGSGHASPEAQRPHEDAELG